ncbi:GntR family transcriptional regulator [Kiritimatiellota bacterium B12222]|nr:GntR family transcriptional regulator [Kiritimatiellota bacterium B12222]
MPSVKNKKEDLNKVTPYTAIKNKLRNRILSGQFGPGGQLTPEMELCRQFNISRSTVRRAISELVEEGLLVRHQGKGTYVSFQRSETQQHLLSILVCQFGHVLGAYDLCVKGAMSACAERGYELLVSNSQNNPYTALDQVKRLNEIRVAGTIVMPLQTGPDENEELDKIVQALHGADQQVVIADTYAPESEFPSISSQNREAMHELTSYVIAMGHKKIAFLTSHPIESVIEREEGFRQAMAEHNLEIPPHYFLQTAGLDPAIQGRQAVDVFMAMREPPEAIICLHDLIALNVLKACEKRGWKVPEEVSVVGFDDLPSSAITTPPLTTMHQPLFEMGEHAAHLLIDRLEKTNVDNDLHPRLPCRLVERDSCTNRNR